jgi:hypothetical protein
LDAQNQMKLLNDYLALQAQIHAYFGYVEDWRAIPIEDRREYFWRLNGEGPGTVGYAKTEQELADQDGDYYEDEIYTQRHLPRWVYRGAEFSMVCVDTHTDGNKFLAIFDNAKERPGGVEGRTR